MENKEIWAYWKKGNDIRIVCNRKQMLVLPRDAKVVYEALKGLRPSKKGLNASNSTREEVENKAQTFAHDLLSEHEEKDAESKIKGENLLNDILGAYKPK